MQGSLSRPLSSEYGTRKTVKARSGLGFQAEVLQTFEAVSLDIGLQHSSKTLAACLTHACQPRARALRGEFAEIFPENLDRTRSCRPPGSASVGFTNSFLAKVDESVPQTRAMVLRFPRFDGTLTKAELQGYLAHKKHPPRRTLQ